MQLTELAVDDSPHNRDGLVLHGWVGDQRVTAFIGRRVMDDWANPGRHYNRPPSLFREEYNALGRRNIEVIERIARAKYQRGPDFNRQHPFVDILFADVKENGEALDTGILTRNEIDTKSV
jgi:hypothetical protein